MRRLAFDPQTGPLRTILCLGAHCDDIEIGCGGTVLRLVREHPGVRVHWIVLSSDPVRAAEAQRGADQFLEGVQERHVDIRQFRNGFFPYEGGKIKEYVETLKGVGPDLVLTHSRDDLHQDHRLVSELTWNTFRDHLILEYEIPKYDGDLGMPNAYVALDEGLARRKVHALLECYPSQREKRWFTEDVFLGLMRLRGVEANSPGRYAEGFYARKAVL